MSRIRPEQVARIAELARLSLSEAEIAEMSRDLDRILGYVAALEELDTEGIEPTAHAIPLETPFRPDRPAKPMDPASAVASAPESAETAFVVPKVLEGGEL